MNNKQLILTLLLIPGLASATQQPAQDFGQVPNSISDADLDYKENEYQEDEKKSFQSLESSSSVLASRSYAIGEMPSNTQNSETNSSDAKSASDRPTYSPEYYEQRVDALLAETKKFLKQWAHKGLYIEVSTALEHIAIVKSAMTLFEAVDHGDIEFVRAHIADSFFDVRSVLLNFNHRIAKLDDAMAAKRIIISLSHLVFANEGITPLMRASARGDTKMVTMLLTDDQYIPGGKKQSKTITFGPWMVDPIVEVNMKDICRSLQKNRSGEIYPGTRMKLRELLEDLDFRQPFIELFIYFDDLTFAVIGGHEEVVDLFLVHEAAQPSMARIITVLKTLSIFSNVAHLPAAQPLFKNLGIPDRPQIEKYPSIARKLVKALGIKFNPARGEYIEKYRVRDQYVDSYARDQIGDICKEIMCRASLAVALAIADELSLKPGKAEWGNTCGILVNTSKSGEKLGLILSMDAHPESLTFQLGMGMLSHVEKNPTLLANLKRYIETNYYINRAVNNHLLPDLSPIVADYIYPRMPAEYVRYIMALGNAQQDPDNNQALLLGEDMQGIMIGERSVVDTTRANRARRSMCSWIVQKMFETCRRRYL